MLKIDHNITEILTAKKLCDLGLNRHQRCRAGFLCEAFQSFCAAGVAKRLDDCAPVLLQDKMIRKANENCIRRAHSTGGGAQILAKPPRCAGQQQRAARIRDQADSAFRHGDLTVFTDHTMRHMASKAHTASHGEAMQKADYRFGADGQLGIEAIFIGPELAPIFKVTGFGGGIHHCDVAACTKRAVAGRIKDNQGHVWICFPKIKQGFDLQTHIIGERIQSVGAVESDAPCSPVNSSN